MSFRRWGYGETCALGHGNDADCTLPKKVNTQKRGITKVCVGSFVFSFVLLSFKLVRSGLPQCSFNPLGVLCCSVMLVADDVAASLAGVKNASVTRRGKRA